MTFPSELAQAEAEHLHLGPLSRTALEARVVGVLESTGFVRTQVRRLDWKVKWKGVSHLPGEMGVYGERNALVDATRETGIHLRLVIFGVVGLTLFGFGFYVLSLPSGTVAETLVAVLVGGGCTGVAIFSLGSDAFWSDLMAVYCIPAGALSSPGQVPSDGWNLEVRGALVRTANWSAKGGGGRAVKEVAREDRMSEPLRAVVSGLLHEPDSLPE